MKAHELHYSEFESIWPGVWFISPWAFMHMDWFTFRPLALGLVPSKCRKG